MAKISMPVVFTTYLVAASFLLSAMALLSSIIAWLSLEFSAPIPHALGFILGILSLVNAVLIILMQGIDKWQRTLALVAMLTSAISLLASVALFIPWVIVYVNFCENCEEEPQTMSCLNSCEQDECCFPDAGRPLAILFLAFSALVILTSLVSVVVTVLYVRHEDSDGKSAKKK